MIATVFAMRHPVIAALLWPIKTIASEIRWVKTVRATERSISLFSYFSPFWSLVAFGIGVGLAFLSIYVTVLTHELGWRPYYPAPQAPDLQIEVMVLWYILGFGVSYFLRAMEKEEERVAQWGHFFLLGSMAGALLDLL